MNNFDYYMLCDYLNGYALNIETIISCHELWAIIMPRYLSAAGRGVTKYIKKSLTCLFTNLELATLLFNVMSKLQQ
ncbi:hypothetical protein HanXRQr2_Chr10g0438161 [Helianthus annuus]|uniref:Uncharacterized protein n=1 Tax=Helianthus annuus TaxID=4232 RepID=A0A9K3N4A3_HELAN|nr:hypothetical protein HanXRQr2_Chr10g0438161 [Helianthus annuus]